MRDLGRSEYLWSGSAASYSTTAAGAYRLSFVTAGVYPSDGPLRRWDSFPVRCLVY